MKRNGNDSSRPDGVARPWEGNDTSGADRYLGFRSLRDRAEEAIDLLQRRKWWVIVTSLVVFLVVAGYTLTQEPLYSARSLVLVSEGGAAQTNSTVQIGPRDLFARNDRSLQNELLILRNSRSLREAVAERLIQLENVPATGEPISLLHVPFTSMSSASTDEQVPSADSPMPTEQQVAMMLEGRVQFIPAARETDLIQITAYSSKPAEAALIADTYMKEYLALTRESSRSQLAASRDYLETQVQERREELEAIEARIKQYKSQENAVALDQEGQNLVARIASVEAGRDEAEVELKTRQASLVSLEEELAAMRPEELSRRVASGVEKELEATQSRIAELELSKKQVRLSGSGRALTPADSAQIAQIDRRIQELRRETQRLSDTYVSEVLAAGALGAGESVDRVKTLRRQIAEERISITGLTARIDVLNQRLQEYEAELSSIPEQSMQLAQLERSRNYAEERYQSVVDQLQDTRIQEETELGYADQVTEATIPVRPIQPRTQRNLILGLIFGLLFGLGLAVGRDKLDSRMYKPDALREMSGLRLLGTVPNFAPVIKEQLGRTGKVRLGDRRSDRHIDTSLIAQVLPVSAAAEAYRHIRTNIQFTPSDTVVETLLVTSPGAGDGKSVTAANLAIVMAQAQRRTLLIDADLRRPRVHHMFDVSQAPGLSEALDEDDPSAPHIHATPIENLSVLTSGGGVGRPAETVGSAALRELVRHLKGRFDIIVMDTPPVLAATDATYLSTQCDGTLLVTRAGETTHHELRHSIDALDDVGASIIGTIFNGFDVSMAYGYKLRYRHYSRYGPYGDYHQYA
jgi:capsular exopolysaccharide synthesis family protein